MRLLCWKSELFQTDIGVGAMGAKDMSHLPIAGAAAATAALHATPALKKDCQQNQMLASTFLKKFLHDLSLAREISPFRGHFTPGPFRQCRFCLSFCSRVCVLSVSATYVGRPQCVPDNRKAGIKSQTCQSLEFAIPFDKHASRNGTKLHISPRSP